MEPRLARAVVLSAIGLAALDAAFVVVPWQPGAGSEPGPASTGKPAGISEPEGERPALHPRAPMEFARPPRAIERLLPGLLDAVRESPGDADAQSNLAYVLLARDETRPSVENLLAAEEHLALALDAAPRLPEALFNHALLVSRWGLRSTARDAWAAFLAVDSSSPWAELARRQLRNLAEETLLERWQGEDRTHLEWAARAGDSEQCRALVSTYPTLARTWIEEQLLPEWAGAIESRVALRRLAEALEEVLHDSTARDTVDLLDASPSAGRAQLITGLRLYRQAVAAYRGFGSEPEKNALFEKAAATLGGAGSPLARWARFYRAVGWHRADPQRAGVELRRLLDETIDGRQPALRARIEWMLGTNEETQNRFQHALEHYLRARELLAESEGALAASVVDLLTAGAWFKLGEGEAAWSARLAALPALAHLGDRQRLHMALYPGLEQLLLEQRFEAARAWADELEANAAAWGQPIGLAEAALQKGRVLAAFGRTEEAGRSFRQAREEADGIGDLNLRRRITATAAVYEAEGQLDTSPSQALAALDGARVEMLDLGYRYQLPRIDTTRGLACLATGDRPAAVAALQSAVDEMERIRREVRNEVWRASAFEGAQRAFDALTQIELDAPDGEARAFGWAERARSRVLLDVMAGEVGQPAQVHPVGLGELVTGLPPAVALLQLAVLPDRVVGWFVQGGQVRHFATEVTAAEVEGAVAAFRRTVERGAAAPAVQAQAARLWQLFLRPIAQDLPPGRPLVLVPDRFLASLPFAALWDPEHGRYLLEERPLLVAPSASAYLKARARLEELDASPLSSVLAVGANHPEAVGLAAAAAEARAVAALYPRSELLVETKATKAAFLAGLHRAEVIHFAGHGREDAFAPRRSKLLFHPAGPDDSGALLAEEVAAERLAHARLAVLASCRSLAGGTRGRETVSGVGAALLAAGVPTVVASLWDTEDQAAARLMTTLHENLRRGLEPSEAMRQAQLNLVRSPTRFHAPQHWAGFVVVGAE